MKVVVWKDERGLKHRSMLRDSDPDSAAEMGILMDPPDLEQLDWDGVRKDIHNALVEREIVTWRDLQKSQATRGIILAAMKSRLINLFKGAE